GRAHGFQDHLVALERRCGCHGSSQPGPGLGRASAILTTVTAVARRVEARAALSVSIPGRIVGLGCGRNMTTTRPTGTRLASPDGAPFASSWRRSQLTVDQRVTRGRVARRKAPRSEHARWEPAPDRRDPVALLEEQAVSRVPELVPIRYGRMLVSPFTFYRGAAAIMAAEPGPTPRPGVN